MFYEPEHRDRTLLPHSPLKTIIAPRPIGWISTLSEAGVANLAPYSFFNMLDEDPCIVLFSSSGAKDSARNAAATGEFVVNLATRDLMEAVNLTSKVVPPEVSEFDLAGLERAPCRLVKPPRVAAAPCALECVHIETQMLKDRHGEETGARLVFGQVVGVHIDERFIAEGRLRMDLMHTLARCGYFDYASIDALTDLPRPR